MIEDVEVKEILLVSKEETNTISYDDFSPFRWKEANEDTTSKLRDRTNSKKISTLYLEDIMKVLLPKKIKV